MSLHTRTNDQIEVFRIPQHASLGCSIIDAEGREVPITEDMIQQACRELELRQVKPAEHE
ncbi:PA1571 family protein [Pseudomonas sp. Irchel 3E20]|uniref:PA1571 family protein n=1 Tax=Pseudomonas sp. Irchel 3E20 TaxID=2008983 RepID=UPI000BA3985A|nr:PA1571 family protein [Pseudomonas sp. Irchel 3E20]